MRNPEKILKVFLVVLAGADLVTSVPLLLFPDWLIGLAKMNSDVVSWAMYRSGTIEPLFARGIGLLWLLTFYLQARAAQAPRSRPELISASLFFRFCGMMFDLSEIIFFLPAANVTSPAITWTLIVFVLLDLPSLVLVYWLSRKAEIKLPLL